MTLETGVRRFSRIDDRALSAAGLNVQTPGAVTRFAAHVYGFFYGCALRLTAFSGARLYDFAFLSLQSRMGGRSEIAHDLFVTGGTFLRPDELRTGNAGRSENCSGGRTAGEQNHRERYSSPGTPQQGFAFTTDRLG